MGDQPRRRPKNSPGPRHCRSPAAGTFPARAIEVAAPEGLRRVGIVKNGVQVYPKAIGGRTFTGALRDRGVTTGEPYLVRAV